MFLKKHNLYIKKNSLFENFNFSRRNSVHGCSGNHFICPSSGDQFLFVKSDGKQIQVEFIDPDASTLQVKSATVSQGPSNGKRSGLTLKKIMLEPQGTKTEWEFLHTSFLDLKEFIYSEPWQKSKEDYLKAISAAGFWESPGRYKTLGDAEYMDRIESGLSTAESLINRTEKSTMPPKLMFRLAQQLYLLKEALNNLNSDSPRDAFMKITSNPNTDADIQTVNMFAVKLKKMYMNWAKIRYMKCSILLDEKDETFQRYTSILAISGFGAFSILKTESGLHVLEISDQDRGPHKFNVKVRVEAQPETPVNTKNDLLNQAMEIFKESNSSKTIIRHYRETPSPLVKDNIFKWRTGKLNHVLDGNFDLYA